MNQMNADEEDDCSIRTICAARFIPNGFIFISICVNPVHLRLNFFLIRSRFGSILPSVWTLDWGGTAGSPHAAVQFRTGPAALRPLPLMLERNWFSANLEGAVEDMGLWCSVLLVF